ncbi:MAG: hypothetical protein M1817_006354 [Caeruleum heppii]|nr:MAG: hypothetical protein M1817_006354 [Caeruleum heppii]
MLVLLVSLALTLTCFLKAVDGCAEQLSLYHSGDLKGNKAVNEYAACLETCLPLVRYMNGIEDHVAKLDNDRLLASSVLQFPCPTFMVETLSQCVICSSQTGDDDPLTDTPGAVQMMQAIASTCSDHGAIEVLGSDILDLNETRREQHNRTTTSIISSLPTTIPWSPICPPACAHANVAFNLCFEMGMQLYASDGNIRTLSSTLTSCFCDGDSVTNAHICQDCMTSIGPSPASFKHKFLDGCREGNSTDALIYLTSSHPEHFNRSAVISEPLDVFEPVVPTMTIALTHVPYSELWASASRTPIPAR